MFERRQKKKGWQDLALTPHCSSINKEWESALKSMWTCYLFTHTRKIVSNLFTWSTMQITGPSHSLFCLVISGPSRWSGFVCFSTAKHGQSCRIKICQHSPSAFLEAGQKYFICPQNANWNLLVSSFWPPADLHHSYLIDMSLHMVQLRSFTGLKAKTLPKSSTNIRHTGRWECWSRDFHATMKKTKSLEP